MDRSINIGQLIVALVKIIILLVLPIVMFTIPLTGIPIPGVWVTGIRMYLMGNMLIILPTIAYLLMGLFALGQMQQFSIWPAVAALVMEIFMLFGAYLILQQGDVSFLLSLIPQEYNTYVQAGLIHLAKPGYSVIINLILSVAYIVLRFIPIGGGTGRGRTGGNSGIGRANVGGMNGQNGQNIGGGISRPKI